MALSWHERRWLVQIWLRSLWFCARDRYCRWAIPRHFYTNLFLYNPRHWRLSYTYPATGGFRITKVERVR